MSEHESNVDDKLWWLREWRDKEHPWIFAISLSPAQEYISEARKGRDLRAGSLLLSYLSFKLYEPLLKMYGAAALIVPDVRVNRFFDLWSKRNSLGIDALRELASGADSITNRAIGLIEEKHLDLLEEAEKWCREAWSEYADFCKKILEEIDKIGTWGSTWDDQMTDFSGAFDVYWATSEANLASLDQIEESMEDVVARLERRKDSRLFGQWEGSHLPKCIQCGHREILAHRDDDLWKKLAKSRRLKDVFDLEENRELLCASCVAKRLFGFEKKIFDREALASTSEVAAAPILEKFEDLYSQEEGRFGLELWTTALEEKGQTVKLNAHNWRELAPFLLAYEMKEEVRQEVERANADWLYDKEDGLALQRPSPYLAVIRFDGDEMGKTLCKHPEISGELTSFSGNVPDIVKDSPYLGTAIYSSGDELLVLVPKANTLATVCLIYRAFTTSIQTNITTCSAGVTFFHCKDSLQYALKECENTLQQAKDVYGRDSVAISVLTASGTPYRFGAQWLFKIPRGNAFNTLKQTEDLIRLLRTDGPLSRAFLYDLAEELPAWIEDPSVLYEDLNATGSVSSENMEPRLPWLWKRHFHSENKASSYDPSVLFKFLVRLAGHLPNVNNRAANFAGYLKVVDFLARGDE